MIFIKKTTRTFALMFVFSNVALSTFANAQDDDKRRGPPPEAIEACTNQVEEASCTFSGRRGDVTGNCFIPRQGDGQLVCAPEGGRPQRI